MASTSTPDAIHDEIARRNSSASPLLKLPREIRHMILERLVEKANINLHDARGTDTAYLTTPQQEVLRKTIALTKVCRQIHVDSSLCHLARNVYRATPEALDRWVMELNPDQRRCIRHVFVTLNKLHGLKTVGMTIRKDYNKSSMEANAKAALNANIEITIHGGK
ncbi:hypothetical protein E8E13_001772 [Curvularia kusanoi]|uniref:Uncharacterized protein n=1 Tax=Curvularia kusanoi TaxID=90978 RepID=A0A9P4T727_CURKU|nr:hypothetical protein E8E13_001772 [Curvularia kusanoi]